MNRSALSSADPEPPRWGWAPDGPRRPRPGKPRDPQRLPRRGPRRLQEPDSGRGGGGKGEQRVPEQGPSGREGRRGPPGARSERAREREVRGSLRRARCPDADRQTDRQPGLGRRPDRGRPRVLAVAEGLGWDRGSRESGRGGPGWLRGARRGEPPARSGPVRGPAGVQQARPAGWRLPGATQQVSGLPAPERAPQPSPARPRPRPRTPSSAGGAAPRERVRRGDGGARFPDNHPLYFGLISPNRPVPPQLSG